MMNEEKTEMKNEEMMNEEKTEMKNEMKKITIDTIDDEEKTEMKNEMMNEEKTEMKTEMKNANEKNYNYKNPNSWLNTHKVFMNLT